MRLAAIGDIHANHIALKTCLEWVNSHNIDGIVFLGDYVTDCPYPMKTVELLRNIPEKYRAWFIKGNRDDYILDYRRDPVGWSYGSKNGSLLYTYENLTDDALDWLAAMPDTLNINIDGCDRIYAIHRPPYYEFLQKLPSEERLNETLQLIDASVILCAHSHVPLVYESCGRLIVNSGPLGAPNQRDTELKFAVLEYTDRWHAEIISLPYDIEAACAEFEPSGLMDKANYWALGVQKTLQTGYEYSVECIAELRRILQYYPDKTELDEDIWEIAARNIGLIT